MTTTHHPPAMPIPMPISDAPGDLDQPTAKETTTPNGCSLSAQTTGNSHAATDPQVHSAVSGGNLPPSQWTVDTQSRCAGGDQTPDTSQSGGDTQATCAGAGPDSDDGHQRHDTQRANAVVGQTPETSPPAKDQAVPKLLSLGGSDQQPPTTVLATPKHDSSAAAQTPLRNSHGVGDTQRPIAVPEGPALLSPLLGLAAEVLDDLERVRIANENRLRALTTIYGLTHEHPDVGRLAGLVAYLADAEKMAVKNLEATMKTHPLWPWCRATAGVGAKQLARLLAAINDPYWNDLHHRPRTVSELWAFCGFHVLHPGDQPSIVTQDRSVAGVAPARRRGQQSNWSETARKRCWLIADSCMKTRTSPYRQTYDQTRTKYADATHTQPCPRCGPKGKPAPTGSPLTPGHQHARALRAVAKTVLKDLWRESQHLHEQQATAT